MGTAKQAAQHPYISVEDGARFE